MATSRRGFFGIALVALLAIGFAPATMAADSATGTWKWKSQGRNGAEGREMTLKLNQDGDKVTGTITGFGNDEVKISDGKVKDGEIMFTVTRKGRNDREMTTKYNVKVEGDTLKGKAESERNGQARSRDFEAKREKEKKDA